MRGVAPSAANSRATRLESTILAGPRPCSRAHPELQARDWKPARAMKTPSIAIIGAGIGGLVLAHALRARGFAPRLYEQSAELAEIGAAVALSANATRELQRLNLLDDVRAASTEPTELIHRDGRTGARIANHPVRLGGAYCASYGAPYFGIHRADLQKALSKGFAGGIHLGHRLYGSPSRRRAFE